MAGEASGIMVTPRLSQLDLLDFHGSKEAIDQGRRAAEAILPSLCTLINEFD